MKPFAAQNIIAIASGKGGVGKTWLSITLAHLMARSGRRVLLFDGDIGLANVDVQLGLSPNKDLGSVIFAGEKLKNAVFTNHEGGYDVIAGRSGSAGLASLGMDKLRAIGEELLLLAKEYDIVLIDLGAGVEQYVRYLAALSNRSVVVITDEPTSLTDAYAFIKLCLGDKPDMQVGIVVNMAATQKEGEQTWQALNKASQNFLKISPPLLGVIRRDNKVKDSIRSQKSLITRAPHTTAATDAAAISIKLMQQ